MAPTVSTFQSENPILTVNISEGIGVCFSMWKSVKNAGIWPSCAPVANNRAEVNRTPFTPPKVDNATNTGITQLQAPNRRSPKICRARRNTDLN